MLAKIRARLAKWRLELGWELAMLDWRVRQKLPGKKTVTYTPAKVFTGSSTAPVAICTLSSEELIDALAKMPGATEKVAMIGRVQTENIGIEKMVQNLVANPAIRFMIICGKDSLHNVGKAIIALSKQGMDEHKRIIGVKSSVPYLFNATDAQVRAFREQIEIIDCTGEVDPARIFALVDDLIRRDPGKYTTALDVSSAPVEHIAASHDDAAEWKFDPKGFFLINLDRENKQIIVEHYTKQERRMDRVITGKTAEELTHTITRLDMVTFMDHACYLGRELAKAEAALNFNLDYEQDKPLRRIESYAMR